MESTPPGEEIVISGIAGRFPDSDNIKHLEFNLVNKINLVSDDDRRWKLDNSDVPQKTGKVNKIEKFDALFFNIHYKEAHTMDPIGRMLLEHAYEAIVDAGVNPRQLRRTRTGVFIGTSLSESSHTWFFENLQVNGYGLTGCNRGLLASRISHWLGVNGPSYTLDSACSSSFYAMECAYRAIRNGECDSALVGGANLCLHPSTSLQFFRLGALSPDGKCKTFDESADGYARSEAISVVFLQKAKVAKRIYSTVIHCKSNCDGFKEQGITFPSITMQAKLLEEFYKEIGLSPTILDYMEAHGTGTKVGDPVEIGAIDKVLCTGRKKPLLLGTIRSNLGHTEPASGLCSIAKIIIAMETGIIPPNLHFKNIRKGIKALEEGRLKVVTEPTPWKGGWVGVNSFGFGGANAHVLLKSNEKQKVNNSQPNDDLPRLVAVSGRTEEAVATLLNDLESRPVDVEYVRLLHDIHSEHIIGHHYRGYTILPPRGIVKNQNREIQSYVERKRPIWFVFSGIGAQWSGMGEALMHLPVFTEAIMKCDHALNRYGIDIVNIITNKKKKIFNNILNSFVGIAAIQIGLVDVLRSVGLEPDNIIGHSIGELGCAYADGCFTVEEMILSAYFRGLAFMETKIQSGLMANVGLGYKDLRTMCPEDIEIACHNSADSTTISGQTKPMKAFIAKLQANGISTEEVPCNNMPYHSRYITAAGSKLMQYLQKVILTPKARSSKWLSTSVPSDRWNTAAARLSSAEYHTNNLLSSVLFEETSKLIPSNAIVIEIAPHGILQATLKRSLPSTVTNIYLTKEGHYNNIEVLLRALGKMYNIGVKLQLHKLYPHVSYPVSCGTPMISPLIKWEHSEDWYVTSYKAQKKITTGERTVEVTLKSEDYEFILGHSIDGRILYPATGYLVLVWETLGMMYGKIYTEVSVVFENVKFLQATNLTENDSVYFKLMIQKGTGKFEITEDGAVVVTGYVRIMENTSEKRVKQDFILENIEKETMTSSDVYKELRIRGYQYSGLFRGIKSASITGSKGHIVWKHNWVTFMDNILQMRILGDDTRDLFVPTSIKKLIIDTEYHLNQIRLIEKEEKEFLTTVNKTLNVVISGGVEIRGLKLTSISRKKPSSDPVLEIYKFIPNVDRAEFALKDVVRLCMHIAMENHLSMKIKTLEFLEKSGETTTENLLSPLILDILGDLPLIQADVNIINNDITFRKDKLPSKILLMELKNVTNETNALVGMGYKLLTLSRTANLTLLLRGVQEAGFLITREDAASGNNIDELAQSKGLEVILEKISGKDLFVLLRKREKLLKRNLVITINNNDFNWVEEMTKCMKEELEKDNNTSTRIIFVGEGDFNNGLIGFINCLRKEPGGEIVRGILIQDPKAPKFSLQHPLYAKELQKDLAISVLRENCVWGSYRHLPLPCQKPKLVPHACAKQLVRGDLSSLNWFEGPFQTNFTHEHLVRIIYSSINFKDVMLAIGKLAVEFAAKSRLTQEYVLGFEYSGVTSKGKRIMGMTYRALANLCIADPLFTWDIPEGWSFQDAATVPCVYGTCFYALYISGKMKRNDKILIHAGSGSVGQAAINLALHEGCEVFTTVGTPEKRQFIRKHFPQIPENHIGNSRDMSFELMVMNQTNGRGVDIVLNSLAEEKLQASVRCLAQGGRFLEIGKFDLAANNPLGMECFLREISFHGIMLDNLFHADSKLKRLISDKMSMGLRNGMIKPVISTIFAKDQLEAAFRFMSAGKHVGKVIIKMCDENEPQDKLIMALPRFNCLENRSYLILGGLGGFGLELADWLILRGAKNIVITSRVGVKNGYQEMRISLWKSYGTKVVIISGKDASKLNECQDIIQTAEKLAPIDAIFNLAVVLKDASWENQTPENYKQLFRAKAWATKNLDELTRKLCPQLRKFVCFSSVSCGRGNAGQTNYGMSNSVMERICERRVAEGLPGLAVQWGAVGDVGLVADMQEDNKELIIGGTLQQKISSCLHELDGFLCQDAAVVSSMIVAEKKGETDGIMNVVDRVRNIMDLKDLTTFSPQTTLAELGMDSMMAMEIKQTLEREFDIILTAQYLRGLNFSKLQEISLKGLRSNTASKDENTEDMATGFKLLIRTIGLDDIDDNVCMKLDTKWEENRRPIFMLPGVEGIGTVYKDIASKIKAPAFCLQFGIKYNAIDDIPEIAEKLLPYVLEENKNHLDFHIVGYSFGTMVAIEVVRKLEARGMNGKLTLIDGSPEILTAIKNQQFMENSESELQTKVLLYLMDIISPVIIPKLVGELEKLNSWDEKVKKFLSLLPSTIAKIQLTADICTGIYNRIVSVGKYNYSSLPPIKTAITLLKPNAPTVRSASEDYGLSQLTEDKVEIFCVEGNHLTILDNYKVAIAINGDPMHETE